MPPGWDRAPSPAHTAYQAQVTHLCQAEGALRGGRASRNLHLHFGLFSLCSGLRMYRNPRSGLTCEPVERVPEPGHSLLKSRLLWPPAARSRQGISLRTRRADLGGTESRYRGREVSSLAGGQHPSCQHPCYRDAGGPRWLPFGCYMWPHGGARAPSLPTRQCHLTSEEFPPRPHHCIVLAFS